MKRTERSTYCLAAVVSLMTLLVYLRALQNDFVEWDDNVYVFDNPFIRSFDLAFFRWASFSFHAGNWHPLTWLSHGLDYALWGLDPFGHHLTNIVLHAITTGLVVLLAARLLEAAKDDGGNGGRTHLPDLQWTLIAAAVTGLLFGLHPAHVESVAWIAERKDLLSALFFVLSILSYSRYAVTRADGSRTWVNGASALPMHKHYLVSFLLFLLSLLSKPMAVSLPVVLLILDWFPFQRMRSRRALWRAVLEKAPFMIVSFASSIVTVLAQQAVRAVVSADVIPLSTRILVSSKSLITYLWKMAVPLNFIPFYPYPTEVSSSSAEYIGAIVLVMGITLTCIASARKQRAWSAVWGYFVVTLLPVIGIVQVGSQAMADRYTYLPSLGPFVMLGVLASRIWERIGSVQARRLAVQIASACIALFLLTAMARSTYLQIGIWKNSFSLWDYVIEKEPGVSLAYNSRGIAFNRRGRTDDALRDFNTAIALNPAYPEAHFNRGIVLEKTGQLDKARQAYDRAIGLNPSYADAYFNRGMLFERMGQRDAAIRDVQTVIALRPTQYEAYTNLGALYGNAGMSDTAFAYFTEAIRRNPKHPAGYYNRGMLSARAGNKSAALSDFQKACSLGDAEGCEAANALQTGNAVPRTDGSDSPAGH